MWLPSNMKPLPSFLLLFAVLLPSFAWAQYPDPGTVNPESYSFTAAATGDLTVYYNGTSAGYISQLGLIVNGVNAESYVLNNSFSKYGDSARWPVTAGDELVFVLRINSNPPGGYYYSDEALNHDGQHIYSAPFATDGTIPDGIYIGFEDKALDAGDLDYTDYAFVATNVLRGEPPGDTPTEPPADVYKLYDVTLAWDHSVSTNVTNYRIYYGTASGVYDTYSEFGYVTTATIQGLEAGIYYFAATAVDADGNESGYSNEVHTILDDNSGCVKADMNCDGTINVLDLQVLANCVSGAKSCPE